MIQFADKTALVTGAARGIGAEIAGLLSSLGARVALMDTETQLLNRQVEKLGAEAVVEGIALDVRDREGVFTAIGELERKWGSVDILVNNAGINRDNLIENVSETDWDTVIDVNLKGPFLLAQAAIPGMKQRGYGRIVNVISRAWLGNIGQSNYSASKGGLVSLTRTLALELAKSNITVNGVAPGLIDTPMTEKLSQRIKERLLRMQPTGKMGSVDDIAAAVCFLASDRAGFITGQILHIDGGKSCGLLSV